jgi:hypothetical protein
MEVTGQYGISDHGDGASFNIQGLLGGNFGDDRGNLTFFTSYYTREAVGQGDRDVTRNAGVLYYDYDGNPDNLFYFVPDHLQPTSDFAQPGHFIGQISGGSGTPPWGWITNNSTSNPFTNLSTVVTTGPGGIPNNNFDAGVADTNCDGIANATNTNTGNISFDDLGRLQPRNVSGLCGFADRSTGSSRYNFNPVNYLQTPYDRWNMALTGRYDISDAIRLKIVANYTDSSQEVSLAPTPVTGLVIDPTLNPFIRLGIAGSAPCGIGVSCHPDLLAALNSRPTRMRRSPWIVAGVRPVRVSASMIRGRRPFAARSRVRWRMASTGMPRSATAVPMPPRRRTATPLARRRCRALQAARSGRSWAASRSTSSDRTR